MGALSLLIAGAAIGIGVSGVAATAVQMTGTNGFCVSCHEMQGVYEEFKGTSHHTNASGVQAGCSDCHLPHGDWVDLLVAKAQAGTRDLWVHFVEGVDTPEELEARRHELAEAVWARYRANDSRFCRSCHDAQAMDLAQQSTLANGVHKLLRTGAKTCIDCHKGIAHELPRQAEADSEGTGEL